MIFIDTGAFFARYVAKDQHSSEAGRLWEKIVRDDVRSYTSNFVLDELFTLLGRTCGYPFAAERARHIYSSEKLAILRPDFDDESEALTLFQKYADQKISFTDCVSSVLIRQLKLKSVFSFDRHFQIMGHQLYE